MITSGNISDMTSAFIRLLVSKNRENTLPEMISSYIQQYKQKKDIHVVTLTTAAPVSEDIRKKIIAQVEKTSNMKNIELQSVVKPEIIGGFILQTGDKLVDASIAYDLKEISRQFENNDFIYKVK
jgi:F-type H+-transporting ATPase subunit delta